MADGYLIRTNGGPVPGTRLVPRDMYGWPLPDALDLPDSGGRYVKVSESQLPDSIDALPGIARGAEYEWRVEEAAR